MRGLSIGELSKRKNIKNVQARPIKNKLVRILNAN